MVESDAEPVQRYAKANERLNNKIRKKKKVQKKKINPFWMFLDVFLHF